MQMHTDSPHQPTAAPASPRRASAFAAFAVLAALSACGGSDDADSTTGAPAAASADDTARTESAEALRLRCRWAWWCRSPAPAPAPGPAPAPAPTPAPAPAPTPAPAPAPTPAPAPVSETLRVSGRELLDTCGQPFVVRGVENFFGHGISINNSWDTLLAEIAKTKSNAVRVLPNLSQLSTTDVEGLIRGATSRGLVVFVSPGDRSWFYRADVRPMLERYKKWLILDVFQEPTYDDRARWGREASQAVRDIRAAGYTMPITVLANQYGRDLPSLLQGGAAVVAADNQRNTILGWQAYWGNRTAEITGGWSYQNHYGMSITEGVDRAAAQPFPIQLGIDIYADGNDPTDYSAVMARAQRSGVGWLYWDWYNPFGNRDNLSRDGTAASLTPVGQEVVTTDANSLARTAAKACGR